MVNSIKKIEETHSAIARNSFLNLGGQIIPLIVGIFAIPIVIRGMGNESFGILSLAWMLLGYLTIFDLGMGRATTKFMAAGIRRGTPEELRRIFWTSAEMNFLLGAFGGILVACFASILAERVFRISPALVDVAKNSFMVLAFSCPVVLVSTAFRGALEAAQEFGYVNIVAVSASSLNFLLPLVGFYAKFNIEGIVILLMISRLCSTMAYFWFCTRVFPSLRSGIVFEPRRLRQLLSYGGWVSISNLVNPVLIYLDRFLIGAMISVAAVTYYAAPYEMVSRMSIFPSSLAMTLFPSFSAVNFDEREGIVSLYKRSTKFLLLFMGPLMAVLIFFAKDILAFWLGGQFSEISTPIVQVLAVGLLMNSLAQIPYSLIQGLGHPDITAKLHLLELLIYALLVWFLVKTMGIFGGAMAWTLRVTADAILLFLASGKFMNSSLILDRVLMRPLALVISMGCVLFGLSLLVENVVLKMVAAIVLMIFFVAVSWRYFTASRERELIQTTLRRLLHVTE
ncbi:MAG TPA: flippase [Bacteroidota bacterium]|nr:flippase [Bacteroidota bacterium]